MEVPFYRAGQKVREEGGHEGSVFCAQVVEEDMFGEYRYQSLYVVWQDGREEELHTRFHQPQIVEEAAQAVHHAGGSPLFSPRPAWYWKPGE